MSDQPPNEDTDGAQIEDLNSMLPGSRRGQSLKQRFREPDSYGLLLVMILLTIVLSSALGDQRLPRMIPVILLTATVLFALRTSRAPRWTLRVAVVALPIVVVTTVVAASSTSWDASGLVSGLNLLLLLMVLAAVLRRMGTHLTISWQTVLGGLCIYLLLGLIFASLYGLVGALSHGHVFAQTAHPSTNQTLYFSYITLTTVGYGDLTPGFDLTRMLAVTEALFGQIYLVAAVGLLVGNLGRHRQPRTLRGGHEKPSG